MNKSLIVLGMHRSGTSCLAGSLQEMGLYLGEVHEWNPFNKKGNRENQQIMDLNDAVLAYNDSAWNKVPVIGVTWSSEHASMRDQILDSLSVGGSVVGQSVIWGFKDPRTLLALDFWRDGIDEFNWIGTFRHPMAVARSLQQRSGMSLEEGIELWLEYNKRLLALCQNADEPRLLCFDQPSKQYQKELHQLVVESKVFGQAPVETRFFASELRNQYVNNEGVDLEESVLQVYYDLYAIYKQQFF